VKKFLRITGIMLLIVLAIFGIFLGYISATDYKPEPREKLTIEGTGQPIPDSASELSFMIWNIGYGGLGAQSDFFFDGGQGVRADETTTQSYLAGITEFLKQSSATDFILLQEVDIDSRRSWHNDQTKSISQAIPDKYSSFAINYDSKYVPQPITNPYGKCKGGLFSLSSYQPTSATRIALTPDAKWPVGLFMLDRCLLEWRYTLNSGKELVVYNLHLSAYDDGTVKQSQMDTLKNLLTREFEKGNYVVAGGDWNQSPPGYKSPRPGVAAIVEMNVPDVYPAEGWKWAFDTAIPTNRKLNEIYTEGQTGIDILDFFLLSPNVEVVNVKNEDLGFKSSDHQPVKMTVRLK
jgi:endonuclease/exonuclease/phosphatase family metal-dependent hydrolase